MNLAPPFVPNAQPSVLVQPSDRALDHPAPHAQATVLVGSAMRDLRFDPPRLQHYAVPERVVTFVTDQPRRPAPRAATLAGDGRDRIDHRDQLRDVRFVRRADRNRQWDALGIGDQVMLGALLAAVRGVRTRLGPPKTARTLELSITVRSQ